MSFNPRWTASVCPKCGFPWAIRKGRALGRQRWQCKMCECQYTVQGVTFEQRIKEALLIIRERKAQK